MVERARRLPPLTPLADCSFGQGKCVFADAAEAARRCPRAARVAPAERVVWTGTKAPGATAPEAAEYDDWY